MPHNAIYSIAVLIYFPLILCSKINEYKNESLINSKNNTNLLPRLPMLRHGSLSDVYSPHLVSRSGHLYLTIGQRYYDLYELSYSKRSNMIYNTTIFRNFQEFFLRFFYFASLAFSLVFSGRVVIFNGWYLKVIFLFFIYYFFMWISI